MSDKVSPFDIVKHLNEKNSFEFDIKDYSTWMINKALSFHMQTIPYANQMNMMYQLETDQQYTFHKLAIPKGKRFGKWEKKAPPSDLLKLIMYKYFCNAKVAEQYASLMSEEQKQQISESKGGRNGTR